MPNIRSITPFNTNNEKTESKSGNKIKINFENKKINEMFYNNNNNGDKNNVFNYANNNKLHLNKNMRNIRKLNFNKKNITNLSQIKTKFINFIKPNYNDLGFPNYRTEIN